jgi:hypothetical protein
MDSKKYEIVSRTLIVILALLLPRQLSPADITLSDADSAACIEQLEIPTYTVFSRSARLTGTAEALLYLDHSGRPGKVVVSGVSQLLQKEVADKMADSRFLAQCGGKTIRIIFVYELVGEEKYGIGTGRISFAPPNRFIIRNNPPMVMVD